MKVACTSMIHAAAPHFLWPFAVRYAAHQLNLWPRVSLPQTSPTLCWTGEVGDASVFRVWGSRAFDRDTSADKLSACAIPCVFLGFVPDAPGGQFYQPNSRHVLPSQDVTFDETIPLYCLFSYRSAPPPPPPLFLAPGPPPVDPLQPQGPAPSGVSQVNPLPHTVSVEVAVGSGAASGGAASGGAKSGGAGSEGAGSGGAEPGGEEPRGDELEGVEPGGAESEGAESGGAEPRGAGDTRAGGAGVTAGAGGTGGTTATGPGGTRTRGTGATGTGGVGGARARDPTESGAAGAGGSCAGAEPEGAALVDPGAGGAGDISQPSLQPASPLPAPSPYTEESGVLTQRREPASRLISHVRTAPRVPRSRPPRVPDMHTMALRPSSVPLRVPLPAPPGSSLPEVRDPESDRARAASPTVSRLLATTITNPSFVAAATSVLVAELLDFAAACRLDHVTTQVVESASASPPSVGDALDIPTPRSYAEAITGPYSSQWQAPMDAEMASWKAIGTYVVEITTLRVLLHVAAQRDYELHSLDFSTAFLQGSLHEEIWLRRPPGFTRSFSARTEWSLRQPVYSLRQARREWYVTLKTTLAPSTADPTLFSSAPTPSLPPFYVLVYVGNLVFATAHTDVRLRSASSSRPTR
ncbi:unnamed protein product [Closterium sp. NIES-53]